MTKPPALSCMYYLGRPTHYRAEGSPGTACGLVGTFDSTTVAMDATCGNCHRSLAWKREYRKWKEAQA